MMNATSTLGLVLGLAVLFVPLSLLWAYAVYDSARHAWAGRGLFSASSQEEDFLGWPTLLLLTGIFGGIAYLALVLLPRLQKSRPRLPLRALGAA